MGRHTFGLALASAAFLVGTGCGEGAEEEERASPLSASKSAVHGRRGASAPVQELTGLSHLPSPADDGAIGASLRLAETIEAHERVEQGAVIGNVVVTP